MPVKLIIRKLILDQRLIIVYIFAVFSFNALDYFSVYRKECFDFIF